MVRRRLVTASLVFALVGAWLPHCGGWQLSAQSRHECCVEGKCPGQVKASHDAAHHSPGMTQTDPDLCCASAEERNQNQTAQLAGAVFLLAPPAENATSVWSDWRPAAPPEPDTGPIPLRPERLHLLFSVFLV